MNKSLIFVTILCLVLIILRLTGLIKPLSSYVALTPLWLDLLIAISLFIFLVKKISTR